MSIDKRQRSVSFNNRVRCVKCLHIDDYTDDEHADCWFSQKEYADIKKEIRRTVAMMNQRQDFEEGVTYSSRGIEHRAADRIHRTVERRRSALDAVLDEQEFQRLEGIHDPVSLSLGYAEYSFFSHMTAYLKATVDETIAWGYNEDKKKNLSHEQRRASKSSITCTCLSKSQEVYPHVTQTTPVQRYSIAA